MDRPTRVNKGGGLSRNEEARPLFTGRGNENPVRLYKLTVTGSLWTVQKTKEEDLVLNTITS